MTTFQDLPVDIYTHFNLNLYGLINLSYTSTYIYNLIRTSTIRIHQNITYKEHNKNGYDSYQILRLLTRV